MTWRPGGRLYGRFVDFRQRPWSVQRL